MISKSGCMECGAPVLFEEFSPVASCPSCGTAHRLPRDSSGAWILTYSNELQMDDARERAMEIVEPKLGRSRRSRLEIVETFPIHLPVWKAVCHATGWFRSPEGEVLPLSMSREMRIPAYENASRIGVPKDINGSDAHTSPDRDFPMMHVKIGPSELREEAERLMEEEVASVAGGPEDGNRVTISLRDPVLALYPAWIVRFRTRNGEHSLTIDGITGQSMNVVDIQVADEKILSETALALVSGCTVAAGTAMSFMEGIHGTGIGLIVAGAALFGITNMLRLALKSSRLSPKPKGRRAST